MKLTVDTNVLWDAVGIRRNPSDRARAKRLLELHDEGKCQIWRTTRVAHDAREGSIAQKIKGIPQLSGPPLGTAFRLGSSKLDEGDFLVDEQWTELEHQLKNLLFPGSTTVSKKEPSRLSDLDHLLGHRASGNDIFVTRDKEILHNRKALASEFKIDVMSPQEVLDLIEKKREMMDGPTDD